MERMFSIHEIRRSRSCLPVWTLNTLDAGGLDRPEQVIVPGVWESHPALRGYRGRGVYSQRLICGGNVRFWFGGVSFRAKVFLDDTPLAEHYGAYTGFEAMAVDVPRGEHTLRVEVDNRYGEQSALHVPNDYYAYGGINRPVTVEELGEAFIVQAHYQTRLRGGAWVVDAEVVVCSLSDAPLSGELTVNVARNTARKDVVINAGETAAYRLSIPCEGVRPWMPEDPALYAASAILSVDGRSVDDLIDRVGFREISVEGKHILLNGRPLRLKGFNRHEEFGDFGLSVPVEAMMMDLQLMRDMGANCVRTCHYPNDPRFLDLCDMTGMLVWEESHVRGFDEVRMRHPLFMAQLRACTEEMVAQHYNHPCIFVWGSLNECADDTQFGVACYKEVFSLLHNLDSTRPVTAALLERPGGRAYRYLDIVSFNIYTKWYHDTPIREDLDRKLREVEANGGDAKPVIIGETGAGAIYGSHDPLGHAKWSEERQCDILTEQITAILSTPDIAGVFLWQFADVRVDEEWAMQRPGTRNNKGILNSNRNPKLAYQTVKDLFERWH